MASDNTFLWIVLSGAAAYGAYRWGHSRGQSTSKKGKSPLPLPPAKPPKDTDYTSQWNAALDRYEIDVYPPEAEPDIEFRMPPPAVNGIAISRDCRAVSVGEDWWELALEYADSGKPVEKQARDVLRALAPVCARRDTLAVQSLRKALKEWLTPRRNPPQAPPSEGEYKPVLLTKT